MTEPLDQRAIIACRRYAELAQQIDNLTRAITLQECPYEGTGEAPWEYAPSCFEKAKEVDVPQTEEDMPCSRRRTLDEIESVVADCESCSTLVRLIRARRKARQRLGAAKRWIRRIGTDLGEQDDE